MWCQDTDKARGRSLKQNRIKHIGFEVQVPYPGNHRVRSMQDGPPHPTAQPCIIQPARDACQTAHHPKGQGQIIAEIHSALNTRFKRCEDARVSLDTASLRLTRAAIVSPADWYSPKHAPTLKTLRPSASAKARLLSRTLEFTRGISTFRVSPLHETLIALSSRAH